MRRMNTIGTLEITILACAPMFALSGPARAASPPASRLAAAKIWPAITVSRACPASLPLVTFSSDDADHVEVRDFPAGGKLTLRVRAGDVRIRKGADDQHIRLRYTIDSNLPARADRVKLRFDVRGPAAEIEFTVPQHVDIRAEIELPAHTDLDVKISAGELHVENIEGNQMLRTSVGDIRLDLGPTPNYSRVDASTHIGDVAAGAFGATKGWLGKSLRYRGDGPYWVDARVGIGDVSLR